MTQEERIIELERQVEELKALHYKDNFSTSQIFRKDISFIKKIGFFGNQPVTQQGPITTPVGGGTIDTQARASIVEIKTALDNYGLTQ